MKDLLEIDLYCYYGDEEGKEQDKLIIKNLIWNEDDYKIIAEFDRKPVKVI